MYEYILSGTKICIERTRGLCISFVNLLTVPFTREQQTCCFIFSCIK